MTPAKFALYVRKQTKTNSTTLDDPTLLLYMNLIKDEIVDKIAKVNEDIFGLWAYRNLVAGQRQYSLPEALLNNTKRLEIDLEGNGEDPNVAEKWKVADEFDLNFYHRSTDEDEIRSQFSGKRPAWEIFGNTLIVYSHREIIDVKDGLKMWYIRYPDDIPNLTEAYKDLSNDLPLPISAGISRQVHLIWADMVVVMYKNSKEKPIPLTESEKNVESRLEGALRSISGLNLDRVLVAQHPNYDNGYNY